MAKKILQDLVKVKKDSFKSQLGDGLEKKRVEAIKIPITIKKDLFRKKQEDREEEFFKEEYDNNPNINNNTSKYGIWTIAFCSVIFLLFAISFLFAGAKVTVNPKVQSFALNQDLTALKDTSDDSSLSFDLVAISGEETKTVQGGAAQDIALKAGGKIKVFNVFSESPQILSINTKLDGSNGKVYKITENVTVPGMDSLGNPGFVEADVLAQDAGEEYNSSPLDFKISNFKGTAKYAKIYARSEGDITGGLKGNYAQISDVDKTNTINDLRNTLQNKLFKKAIDQIPEGYILFKDAAFLSDDGGSTGTPTADGLVPITIKGTFYGFLFQEKKLTDKIIQANIKDSDGSDLYIQNIQDLNFSLADKENISFKDVASINFNISGLVKIVSKVDTDKIVGDLLGRKKGDFNDIMSQYPNVDSADLNISPVWALSFPDKSKDINVIVNYPK